MLKHSVEINVSKKGKTTSVLTGGEMTLRDRILTALLGRGSRMLVLVPADSVQSVAIKEIEVKEEGDAVECQ